MDDHGREGQEGGQERGQTCAFEPAWVVLRALPVAVVVIDRGGVVLSLNPAAERALGWREELLRGRLVPVAMDGERWPRNWQRATAGESIVDEELRWVHASGELVDMTVSTGPLHDAAGAVIGTIAVLTRPSDQRQIKTQLLLVDRMVSLGMLAAGVAHEINNPLAYVRANLGFVADALRGATPLSGPLLQQTSDAIAEAQEGAGRVQSLVADMRAFCHPSDDERRAPVDVRAVVDSSLNMVQNEIKNRARLVRVYGPVARVLAHEGRLGQVFLNLLVNAAHAIAPGKIEQNEIRVATVMGQNGEVVVDIADTGVGIAPAISARLFEPFFTTKPVGVGTGLGLFISRTIITSLGGSLRIEAREGPGTLCRVTLPAA